jgi:2TM domain-containing protein
VSRRYTQEEVEEILRRALARQEAAKGEAEQTSHEDLVAAAREVGIDAVDLDAAAAELAEEKARAARPAKATALAPRPGPSPLRRFLGRVATFAIVNGLLLGIDAATGPGWWVQWVALFWGIGLLFQARRIFFPTEEDAQREARHEARRAERKAHKQAREVERRIHAQERRERRERHRRMAREFEEVVEAGVHALLGQIAKAQHGGRARVEPPKVRVEVDEEQGVEAPSSSSATDRSKVR